MRLVIVESPNKIKKITALLGAGFEVAATAGHFRDLPDDDIGVDLATFDPVYVLREDKSSLISRIKKLAATASEVLLATDADREGEAIAWHLSKVLKHPQMRRIRFQELTAGALKAAVAAAGPIDNDLVDAQQARRVLDRLVGYQISPLLSPFGSNHSAGRVQSAALHLVVEREKAREAFKPQSFWTLVAKYGNGLVAKHVSSAKDGVLTESRFPSQAVADSVAQNAAGPHTVSRLETTPTQRKPKPPFTTSTLQQAASVVLGLKPGATMELAQALFEKGLITYHRTDSVALSAEAIAMARSVIELEHPEALPPEPVSYANKADAQEAHEAIRPTHLPSPEADALTGDEARLFDLIRRRFLACQCRPAQLSVTTVTLTAGTTTWRATGSVVLAANWLLFMANDEDADAQAGEEPEPVIPPLSKGQLLEAPVIEVKGGSTKPPPRFTQASLVKELERLGIGRPSTYASIVDDKKGVLFVRAYLAEEKKTVLPTPRGRLVDAALSTAFEDLVDAAYTARMEARLDGVARGERRWKDILRAWYPGFARQLAEAPAAITRLAAAHPEIVAEAEGPKQTGEPCPACGKELLLRHGKKGAFLACSGYPGCTFSADPSAVASSRQCPKCGKPMLEQDGRYGRYARCSDRACGGTIDLAAAADEKCPLCSGPMKDRGEFLSCSRYPECKGRLDKKALAKSRKAGKTCAKCGAAMLERKSARGKFWGCSRYPECKHLEPIESKKARAEKTGRRD